METETEKKRVDWTKAIGQTDGRAARYLGERKTQSQYKHLVLFVDGPDEVVAYVDDFGLDQFNTLSIRNLPAPTPPNTPAEATLPKSGRRVKFFNLPTSQDTSPCWFEAGEIAGLVNSNGNVFESPRDWEPFAPNQWPGVLNHLDAIDAYITAQESAKAAPEPQKPPRFDHTTWPLGAWVRHKGCFNQRRFSPCEVNTEGLVVGRDVWTWGYLAQDAEMTTDGGTTWRACVP